VASEPQAGSEAERERRKRNEDQQGRRVEALGPGRERGGGVSAEVRVADGWLVDVAEPRRAATAGRALQLGRAAWGKGFRGLICAAKVHLPVAPKWRPGGEAAEITRSFPRRRHW
jgi:hypothetical protein